MVKNHRAHTRTPALAPHYTPVEEVLFTFAHHIGRYFKYSWTAWRHIACDESRRKRHNRINRHDSVVAINAFTLNAKA